MSQLRFTTAGESHGPGLVALIEGMPSGVGVRAEDLDAELLRRQGGYGRGGRMRIESDAVEILGGIRHGRTLGSPVALLVRNRDHRNWLEAMSPAPLAEGAEGGRARRVTRPRPGHADLAGLLKHGFDDARDVLERASARETAARVAAGALAKRLLAAVEIRVESHVVSIGGVQAGVPEPLPEALNAEADRSPVRCLDAEAAEGMVEAIDAARSEGDTLGGVFEVVARGVPVGLGSHVSWDRKLDGRLAGALMSIHAIKGVEIGAGFAAAGRRGSQVHDPIVTGGVRRAGGYGRGSNRAGGLEGGITSGGEIVVRAAMKPISTLMRPLATVELETGAVAEASVERSDVCAVPAASVVGEAMVALVLAGALLEKFGGDSLAELQRNLEGYLAGLGA
jgi:chorismate synthase